MSRMPRRNPTVLACVAAWVVLGVEGRAAEGFHVDAEGKPQAGATCMPPDHLSVQSLSDANLLDPEELGVFGASNTSARQEPSSRPSQFLDALNTTKFNASASFPSPPTPSTLGLQAGKSGGFNSSLHSSTQPSRVYNPLVAPQSFISNASPPSSTPSLMQRIAAKEVAASGSFKLVNFSASGDFALPKWERAPRVLTTQANYSRVYRLPAWESSLSLFGVKSSDEVRIALLHRDRDEAPMNITLHGPDGDSEIYFNLSRADQVNVSRHSLTLNLNKHTWFTIFRKQHFLAVFLAGSAAPILVYEHSHRNLNLLRYTRLQLWSKKAAYWDLVGRAYRNENKGTSPADEAVKEELRGIEEGLAERFGLVMNLVGVLQRPSIVDNLTLSDIQEIKDMGESIVPLRNILFYYDFIFKKNMHWTSV